MDRAQELIEAPLSMNQLAARYRALCDDPCYANVPGKLELDVWGRALMTPPSTYHGVLQGRLCARVDAMEGGEPLGEVPVATPMGVFVTDAAWASDEFIKARRGETPLLKAPQVCIEVVSPSNSVKELREKIAAYLAAGAQEVWIVYPQSKRCEFYARQGVLQASAYPVDLTGLFD
jgi:Uma2 family endonuclease